jgi:hypothetical protein
MGMKENIIQVLLVSRRNDLASSNTKIKIFPCLKDASKKPTNKQPNKFCVFIEQKCEPVCEPC